MPEFFGIPAELRYMVYFLLRKPKHTIRLSSPPFSRHDHPNRNGTLQPSVDPQLLLVSTQFKAEYEEEIFRHAKLVVWTCDFDLTWGPRRSFRLSIPDGLFHKLRFLDLQIDFQDFAFLSELYNRRSPLYRFLCLPSLRSVSLQFEIWLGIVLSDIWASTRGEMLANLQKALDAAKSFPDALAVKFPRLDIDAMVLFWNNLFELNGVFESPNSRHLWYKMDANNNIKYRPSLSKSRDPYTWQGISLEVDSVGYFDEITFNELLKESPVPNS